MASQPPGDLISARNTSPLDSAWSRAHVSVTAARPSPPASVAGLRGQGLNRTSLPVSEAMAGKAPAFGALVSDLFVYLSLVHPPACQSAAAFACTHLSAFLPMIVLLIFLFVSLSLYQLPWQPPAPASVSIPPTSRLTAIVVQGGELGRLVAAASAVARPHAELVPRGLSQFRQKYLPRGVGPEALPGPGALGPELQRDGRDGAAPVAPALQVQPRVRGVDVGEQMLVFAEGGLWGQRREGSERLGGAGVMHLGWPRPPGTAAAPGGSGWHRWQ